MTVQPLHLTRPELTMPPDEAEALRLAYAESRVILEYGPGGSTVMAAEMTGKHIFAVESDQAWARRMKQWFGDHPPANGTRVDVVWSDIGPTGEWGHPLSDQGWRNYPSYCLGVWNQSGFRHPDVVLVDGRFRAGCALATAFCIERPVTLLMDDYTRREWVQQIEEFLGKPDLIGRLAIFEVEPMQVPADRLMQVFRMMTMP